MNPYVWAQPVATVGAALIALVAAALAYWGVSRQIKANAENVQKQMDAAAQNTRDQLEAMERHRRDDRADEWLRLARSERRELLFDAYRLADRLARLATEDVASREGTSDYSRDQITGKILEAGHEAADHTSELRLVALNDVAEALEKAIRLVLDFWESQVIAPAQIRDAAERVHKAVRKELAIASYLSDSGGQQRSSTKDDQEVKPVHPEPTSDTR